MRNKKFTFPQKIKYANGIRAVRDNGRK